MVPVITHKHLKNVTFPVFKILSEDLEYIDGLVLYQGRVLDDTNQSGDTLGKRRLQTPHKLQPLRRGYYDIQDMIRANHNLYIDSKGNAFKYKKTEFTSLKYKKIRKVEKKEVASTLWAYGISVPFSIVRPPPADCEWVGILYYRGYPWKIYEYSETKKPNRRKKI